MPFRRLPLVGCFVLSALACAQDAEPAGTPSVDVPAEVPGWVQPPARAERFAPEILSPNGWTFTPTLTPDLQTAYVVRWDAPDLDDPTSIQELFVTRWDGSRMRWSEPQPVAETAGWRVDWPHVSPDGQQLLISFNKPHAGHFTYPGGRPSDDFDLWEARRLPDGSLGEVRWGPFEPMRGDDLNRQKTPENARIGYVHNETNPRTDRDGTLYFWTERLDDGGGRRDVYRAEPDGEGGYRTPTLLPFNTARRESGVAVDPDGRWVVFASEGLGGEGGSDLFVVVREDDEWGQPVNLGSAVNSSADDSAPEVTADGRILLFTSSRRVPGVPDVEAGEGAGPPPMPYWVDLRGVEPFVQATRTR